MSEVDLPEQLTRQALYDLVWSEPMRKLAPRWGLSDRGLAKLCDRFVVPRPPMGYWVKRAHGKATDPTPLPPWTGSDPPRIYNKGGPERRGGRPAAFLDPVLSSLFEAEFDPPQKIRVPQTLRTAPGLVTKTRVSLRSGGTDKFGLSGPCYKDRDSVCNVVVAPSSIPRAMRLLAALIKAVDQRGGRVLPGGDKCKPASRIELEGVELFFRIREKTTQQPHVLTKKELRERAEGYHWSTPRYDYHPTGRLNLELSYAANWGTLRLFKDTQKNPIEDQLNHVLADVYLTMDRIIRNRVEQEKIQQVQAENEQRQKELAKEQALEQRRFEALLSEVSDWHTSQTIRAYLDAVRSVVDKRGDQIQTGSELDRWVRWATDHADHLDPLTPTQSN